MAQVQIKAKTGGSDPVSVPYDFGNNDEEFVKKYTLPITVSHAKASMIVAIQDVIRAGITNGDSVAVIVKTVAELKFGVKKRGKSRAEKLAAQFGDLDPDERARLIKELRV